MKMEKYQEINKGWYVKGYSQEEGMDYGETFSHVARLQGVRTLLAYATYRGFKVYQMDAKSSFLNGILDEEVTLNSQKVFLILTKGTWSANYTKHYMVSNKPLELGMKDYITI